MSKQHSRRDLSKLIPWDSPDIVKIFEEHCQSGWSPRLFISKIEGGEKSFRLLLATNPAFKTVNDHYKFNKGQGSISVYSQYPGIVLD